MATLIESLSRIASRMEILARGVEGDRVAAERMLDKQRPLEAREHARAILARVPDSPLGLALWADAAELAWLDHEAVQALEALAQAVPWRADVWLRLGRAGLRTGYPHARDALERAAAAPDERDAARRALLDLCDLDLAAGDPGRALRWLERLPSAGLVQAAKDEAALLRRAECDLALGHTSDAEALAKEIADTVGSGEVGPPAEDEREPGRRELLFARIAWLRGDPVMGRAAALSHALRAYILEVPGARELLATMVAQIRDAKALADVRAIVAGAGHYEDPTFVSAFAFAEGRSVDARSALVRAVSAGDALAAPLLARLATETRDVASLEALAKHAPGAMTADLAKLLEAARAIEEKNGASALAALDATGDDDAIQSWADDLRAAAYGLFVRAPHERSDWPAILDALLAEARSLGSTRELMRVEGLGAELDRPIVVAIVGEFNAGKSTFINAFLGVDVAPTGILPTTATLHRVAWAADRFARVLIRGAPDRVVSHEALKATLNELQAQGVDIERVQIYAPIERLRWVEILDTPGFNAPNPEHARAAMSAFDEVHAVVWLLDSTGPLKATEGEILKKVDAMGLPIVVLSNKLDRVAASDLPAVMEHTAGGLGELEIRPAAGPIAFSAKLALAGRLGDAASLEKSRWSEVEEVLSRTLVDRADVLREQSMRRRASKIALDLAADAASQSRTAEDAHRARAARAAKLRAAGAPLFDRPDETALSIAEPLDLPLRALEADLRPLSHINEAARDEATIVSYAAPRAVARLAGPIVGALSKALELEAPTVAVPFVSAALEGCVAGAASGAGLGERSNAAMLRASTRAFAAALLHEAADLEARVVRPQAERRLRALSRALAPAAGTGTHQNGAQR